ncbi:helicase associated domain-containing protein [Streptomyces sp. NBC_00490]
MLTGGYAVRAHLGSFIANARRRAAKLSPERREALNTLGMRW